VTAGLTVADDRPAPRLVVLRGNSGAGKTTLAGELQRALGPGTALVGQDHLRRVVLREHDVPGGDNIGLIAHTVRHCLGIGYDVVLEGILVGAHYAEMLREIVESHRGASHVFYLDVPLEETVRRHGGRPLRDEVSVDRLRSWFVPHDVLGVPGEVVLDGRGEVAALLASVLECVGPVARRTPRSDAARFL
jgi:adenylate kinase family enzyme